MEEQFTLQYLFIPPENNVYRKYYFSNPAAYRTPITSWKEFCDRFADTEWEEKMPEQSPTYIDVFFEEDKYFFPDIQDEVALLINVPYCPPFLHRLAFIKIVYVLHGSCFLWINGEEIHMKEGAFCLVGPNVEQSVYSCNDDDVVVNMLIRFRSFSESFLNLMTEQGIMSEFLWRMLYNRTDNGALIYRGKKEAILSDVVMQLCEEILWEREKSNLIRKSLLMVFCGYVLRLHEKDLVILERTRRESGYRLPQLLCYIRENLDCRLPEVAARFEVSEGYLSRYIRRETGKTFSELLCEFRMRRAAKMLENTDFSIDKIIETVGYTDKSRFYRNFSEMYGMTPLKYRKRRLTHI